MNTSPGACEVYLFTDVIVAILLSAGVFATAIYFHPSLIFVGMTRSLLVELSPETGSALIGYLQLRP